jgi:hypothetical protein
LAEIDLMMRRYLLRGSSGTIALAAASCMRARTDWTLARHPHLKREMWGTRFGGGAEFGGIPPFAMLRMGRPVGWCRFLRVVPISQRRDVGRPGVRRDACCHWVAWRRNHQQGSSPPWGKMERAQGWSAVLCSSACIL